MNTNPPFVIIEIPVNSGGKPTGEMVGVAINLDHVSGITFRDLENGESEAYVAYATGQNQTFNYPPAVRRIRNAILLADRAREASALR